MKIKLPRYVVKIVKRNGAKQQVGTFDQRERAVAYGEKYYAGRYTVIDREPDTVPSSTYVASPFSYDRD